MHIFRMQCNRAAVTLSGSGRLCRRISDHIRLWPDFTNLNPVHPCWKDSCPKSPAVLYWVRRYFTPYSKTLFFFRSAMKCIQSRGATAFCLPYGWTGNVASSPLFQTNSAVFSAASIYTSCLSHACTAIRNVDGDEAGYWLVACSIRRTARTYLLTDVHIYIIIIIIIITSSYSGLYVDDSRLCPLVLYGFVITSCQPFIYTW